MVGITGKTRIAKSSYETNNDAITAERKEPMLAYTEIGTGLPVILIHGLGSKKEAWHPQHVLGRKYRLIMPDLRGHGETELEDDITLPNFAKDILELMDSLNIMQAVICGLSLGGIIAQEIYKQAPKRVSKLILANTAAYISPFFVQGYIAATERCYQDKDYPYQIATRGLYRPEYTVYAAERFLIRKCYMDAFRAPIGINYFPLLWTIDIPVLLIGSRQDKVTPIMNMHMMALCIRRVRKVIFDECGHLSNIEKGFEFNRAVDTFIQGVSA
jgi:pimeloyl-ACP methyl ester carboxylesterase